MPDDARAHDVPHVPVEVDVRNDLPRVEHDGVVHAVIPRDVERNNFEVLTACNRDIGGGTESADRQVTCLECLAYHDEDFLQMELVAVKRDYGQARKTIADMHEAAMGYVGAPMAGVVNDVLNLRLERDELRMKSENLERELRATKQMLREVEGQRDYWMQKDQRNRGW